jgi:hypothetical protein
MLVVGCEWPAFGVRRQSAATTALSDDEGARTESGVALRLPPHSIGRAVLRRHADREDAAFRKKGRRAAIGPLRSRPLLMSEGAECHLPACHPVVAVDGLACVRAATSQRELMP